MPGGAKPAAPIRALVLGRSLAAGGTEKQSIFFTRALSNFGPTTLICLYRDTDERMLRLADAHGIELRFLRGTLLRKFFWLQRYVKREAVDLIVATLPITNLIGGAIALIHGTAVLGGFRNCVEERLGRLVAMRLLHRFLFSGTVANSFSGQDFLLERGFSPETTFVIPNAIDRVEPAAPREDEGDVIRLVTVARMVWYKRHTLALRAFSHVRDAAQKQGLEIEYEIVGYGPEEDRILALIEELSLGDHVRVRTAGADVRAAFSGADIYLCSSLQEGMSNAVMEAMSCGLPVVSTAAGDNPRLVKSGKTGFLSERGTPEDLAGHILTLARDPALRHRMGRAGQRLIEEEYSLSKLQSRMGRVLAELGLRPSLPRTPAPVPRRDG